MGSPTNTRAAAAVAAGVAGGALAALGIRKARNATRRTELRRSISIDRSAVELSELWQRPETLSRVLGRGIRAEVVAAVPGDHVSWRASDGALSHEGTLRFTDAPGDWGTEAHLEVRHRGPGGKVAATLAGKVLNRFKALAETGEIPTTDRNPAARASNRKGA
jgi:uncharacterized membrane protein